MSVSLRGSGELSEYAGTAITVTRSLQQDSKFYYNPSGGTYTVASYSNTAKIYTGSFTLSKRTLVQIGGMKSGYNSLVFLSNSNGIVNKAHNADNLTPEDYSTVIIGSGRVWLNAGTWYIVESSQNYSKPTYKAISL